MNTHKYSCSLILAVVFLVINCFASVSSAASVATPARQVAAKYTKDDMPLMVIRFAHSNVMYEKSLYDTIARALKIRPDARFDIISIARQSSDSDIQRQYDQIAARNSDKVMTTLHEMAVPDDRLAFGKTTENIKSSEVRIYIHD